MSQHMDALKKANLVRMRRIELKRELAAMPAERAFRELAELLEQGQWPDWLAGMGVRELLRACHRMGDQRTDRLFRLAGVTRELTVGGATPRERKALCGRLRALVGFGVVAA